MAKRSGWKIALIVLGCVLALGLLAVGVCIFSGYYWFQENAPALRETGQRAVGEADSFAMSHTQLECIDEGLRKHDSCGAGMALMCRTEARVFVDRCLLSASESPGLCDGVPPPTEIMASARWAVQYCRDHGRANDQQCANFIRAIVDYCGRR